MLQIYCGNGKGKTTAAMGLALRAAGSGMNVHIVQLLKGSESGEVEILRGIKGITLERPDRNYGFTFRMNQEQLNELTQCHNRLLENAEKAVQSRNINMLIIDEFNAAYRNGLLDKNLAERLILENCGKIEIVLTGREPDEKFLSAADYVSEISAVKHPFSKGISARKGIEY